MQDKFIVGVTGPFGSGKSTAAKFFESKGFRRITLSSFLEEEAKKRGVRKITRKILQDLGNELRGRYGKGVLIKKTFQYLKKNKIDRAVIDGIRNFGELEELSKRSKKFILLAILANRSVRFARVKKIKTREKLTLPVFRKLDIRDLGIGEKTTGLQGAYCISVADVFLTNNRTKKDFIKKLERFYKFYER